MTLEELHNSGFIIFECVAGSIAYNLNIPSSDKDIRGIFVLPKEQHLGLIDPVQEISDEAEDIKFYELKKLFKLLITSNPTVLELLWFNGLYSSPTMDVLRDNRNLFISKKAYHTFSGYAYAQIKKAKGQNKMVNNPQLAVMPVKEDFCWVIPMGLLDSERIHTYYLPFSEFPCRPFSIQKYGFNLAEYHVSALEHVPDTYRLYFYGNLSKGVFRGDDMLVCEPILLEDEAVRFRGLLIFNKAEYKKAVIEHKKYVDWMANRNDARWVDQERGAMDFDGKNMMHCMRLLLSGENILHYGFPLVAFEGKEQQFLMDIRHGQIPYDTIMKLVDEKMAVLEDLYKTSGLQHTVNMKAIEKLYRSLI